MKMAAIYSVVFVLCLQVWNINCAVPVTLSVGTLHGHQTTVTKGSEVHDVVEFLGVPFAEPPVGQLRFSRPEPLKSLPSSPYNATYYRPACPQMMNFLNNVANEDEDCLHLNLFVPGSSLSAGPNRAVMIWVHGGGYLFGSGSLYHGGFLAAAGDVIVVTVNYRLGALGFLSTKDDHASGNYGLYDQGMAFQWVHDNIEAFGGDKNKVTIFGESAGAMSVSLQALYPGNQGRFQRVIAESGDALSYDMHMMDDTLPAAQTLAAHLNCDTSDSRLMIDCLRGLPWSEMKAKMLELGRDPNLAGVLEFKPTADGDIIQSDPKTFPDMVEEGYIPDEVKYFRSLDFLNGFNAYDAGMFIGMLTNGVPVEDFQPTYDDMMNSHLDKIFYMFYGRTYSHEIKRALLHEYTNWSSPFSYESIRLQYVKVLADITFKVTGTMKAMLHVDETSQHKTYMYHFVPASTIRSPVTPSWLVGADHMEEIRFVFGQQYNMRSNWEQQLSDQMITYWSNFAKTGNPNSPIPVTVEWPTYNKQNQSYIELDKGLGSHSRKHYLLAKETHFWNHVMPGLVKMEGQDSTVDMCVSGADRVGMYAGSILYLIATVLTLINLL